MVVDRTNLSNMQQTGYNSPSSLLSSAMHCLEQSQVVYIPTMPPVAVSTQSLPLAD
eukprot:m.97973 g.97973  ORF g.97973 m.97973 type:complete len:56 (-) comp16733_c1_seq10:143-310(-)